jgi:hypothetical protein
MLGRAPVDLEPGGDPVDREALRRTREAAREAQNGGGFIEAHNRGVC